MILIELRLLFSQSVVGPDDPRPSVCRHRNFKNGSTGGQDLKNLVFATHRPLRGKFRSDYRATNAK